MANIGNFNVNFSSSVDFSFGTGGANFGGGVQNNEIGNLLKDFQSVFGKLFGGFNGNGGGNQSIWAGGGGCIRQPKPECGCHPSGGLKSDAASGTVTTPGGYQIKQDGQYNWSITSPDGKTTKIEGDPHVTDGDGTKFDFKKDSTFMLGDGTRINVKTKDYGNGMTVTSGLDIMNGNDRVSVTGIDTGKGQAGEVKKDGFQHANDFAGKDVFVESEKGLDAWTKDGKEIIGSENGGDVIKTGQEMGAKDGTTTGGNNGGFDKGFLDQLKALFGNDTGMNKLLDSIFGGQTNNAQNGGNQIGGNQFGGGNQLGANPLTGNFRAPWEGNRNYDRGQHRNNMADAFRMLGRMFNMMSVMMRMTDNVQFNRNRNLMA